jgi:hypothetical protein
LCKNEQNSGRKKKWLRIKGITVEIGGDTTKLQTALKGVNTQVKSTQQQLKDVEKILKPYIPMKSDKHSIFGRTTAA